MGKWIERSICILVGICIAMFILEFRNVHKPNFKEKHKKINSEYILADLEGVLKGNHKFIDDRIIKYVKRHKTEKLTTDKIKEILGDAYTVLKEKDAEKVAVDLALDDIRGVYIASYTLKIEEELYKLDLEVELDGKNNIENIRFVDFILISE